MRARLLPVRLALAALLALPAALAGQERWVVRTEPGTAVVAMEVLVATGPAHEDSAQSGLAFLSARSVIEPIRARLDSLGAHLLMEGHKDAISFSLVSPPETWREASRTLLIALFRDPPGDETVIRQRRALTAELRARESNPADALTREVDRAVFGDAHPWGRPTVGRPATLGRLGADDVDAFLRRYVTPDRSTIAVVGPVEAAAVGEHLRSFLPGGRLLRPDAVAVDVLAEPVYLEYNSITTWIAAVFRLRPDTDLEAARFLAEAAAGALAFGPSRRSIYDVQAEVVARVGGGEMRVQIVVPPQEARRWAQQMVGTIAEYADEPIPDELFERQLRQFRGRRYAALATPESRAREIARAYLVSGDARAALDALESLTPERIRAEARAIGSPTLVFLGPFFDDAS